MTVQHKSNGRTNEYRCTWFDESLKLCSSVFRGDTLAAVQIVARLQKILFFGFLLFLEGVGFGVFDTTI